MRPLLGMIFIQPTTGYDLKRRFATPSPTGAVGHDGSTT
jgi:hypothetical protein